MRVLLIKLTSMGDLIHALPAISDAKAAIPNISFDWVIDKNFSEVAKWHPAVNRIVSTSHRTWKKNLFKSIKNGDIKKFVKDLRKESYDIVIDGQSSVKSAVTSLLAKGHKVGYDKNSCRESLASFAYHEKITVRKDLHAISRLRLLFANALSYKLPNSKPNYGIDRSSLFPPKINLPKRYLVFVHNASWQSKLWPEAYWRQLVIFANHNGYDVLLPWGSENERVRADRISHNNPNCKVLPFCSLSEHATILLKSHGAICSDTGLSHLAAALDVPAITIYGSTSEKLIGTKGFNQQHAITPFSCSKCYKTMCNYGGAAQFDARCQIAVKPQDVWNEFSLLTSIARQHVSEEVVE